MFLKLFAMEKYPTFKLVVEEHFKTNPECIVKTDYKENTIRIWEKLNEIQLAFKYLRKLSLYLRIATILGFALPSIIVLTLYFYTAYRELISEKSKVISVFWKRFIFGAEGIILFGFFLINFLAYFFLRRWRNQKDSRELFGIKDLIRGSIFAECDEMIEAYEKFKTTPGVEIVQIKSLDKMKDLANVTVLFVFQKSFIGEMQMRFKRKDDWYEANHFLYEMLRSKIKIEIL